MAGTPEARKAWIALRGPYLVAYLGLLVTSCFLVPPSVDWGIWRYVSGIVGFMLVIGSLSSYLVVSTYRPKRMWVNLSILEVTGLRALWMFELAFFIWVAGTSASSNPLRSAIPHLMLSMLALGILQSMTWHKGRVYGGR